MPHPATAGFQEQGIAEPAGQVRDWTLPVDDGSRIHVHEYPDGRMAAHRDEIDPDRGPVEAVVHVLKETKVGQAAMIGVGLYLGYRIIKSLAK